MTTRKLWQYDNCCPYCMTSFPWDVLAEKFTGKPFDPDRTYRATITCPKCDSVIEIEMNIDFALREKS